MWLDSLIVEFDKGMRTLLVTAQSVRPHPGAALVEPELSVQEKQHAAALMRVNHCGEVCAQALYQGQALTARNPLLQQKLQQAAQEETEHLAWTEQRIAELGGRLSFLNPLLYTGSLALGAFAGLMGDKWNLGFLAETESQVGHHLESHLRLLPEQDAKSRAIVSQMYEDELSHATMAEQMGGVALPIPIKTAMQLNAKLMTSTTYWV